MLSEEGSVIPLLSKHLSRASQQKMLMTRMLKFWLSIAWFIAAERHLCFLWIQPSAIPWKCHVSFMTPHCIEPDEIFPASLVFFTGLPPRCRIKSFQTWGRRKGPSFTKACGVVRIFTAAQGRIRHIFISSVINICLTCSLNCLTKLSEIFLLPFFISILWQSNGNHLFHEFLFPHSPLS